jgi:hypothetical protein
MWIIPGPVIVDLKCKKLVDRMERFGISRCNANSSTVWDRFKKNKQSCHV